MINRDDWLAAIREAGFQELQDDQQAVTIAEFAKLIGVGRPRAEDRMKQLVALGLATRTTKRMPRFDGALYPVPAYRLKEKPVAPTVKRRR